MNVVKKSPDKYGIYKVGDKARIVRNLKDYDSEKEAADDLAGLMVGLISEKDLIGQSFENEVNEGKQGNRILILEAAMRRIQNSLLMSLGDDEKLDKVARESIKEIKGLLE